MYANPIEGLAIVNLSPRFEPFPAYAQHNWSPSTFSFPGGELKVQIPSGPGIWQYLITSRFASSDDLMKVCLAVDAIRRGPAPAPISLFMPYMAYARQDRVMATGESLSIKVVADIINSLNFERVFIFDPHSDVTPALLKDCTVISSHGFVRNVVTAITKKIARDTPVDFTLIAPDAGALKRTYKLAEALNIPRILCAQKHRNTQTGEITGTSIDLMDSPQGTQLLMVDDICDGGRTFIELAKAIRRNCSAPPNLHLAVSHGIFSNGYEVVADEFQTVWTTTSFDSPAYVKMNFNEFISQPKLATYLGY